MRRTKRKSRAGFTLVELMIVVAIVGVLAAIAISAYGSYITSARVNEALSFMQDIRTKQEAYYAERSEYLGCNYNPATLPTSKVPWTTGQDCWERLGVRPNGSVRFHFATGSNLSDPAGDADLSGMSTQSGDWFYVIGRADLDEDANTDPTTVLTNSLSNTPVILDEGQ